MTGAFASGPLNRVDMPGSFASVCPMDELSDRCNSLPESCTVACVTLRGSEPVGVAVTFTLDRRTVATRMVMLIRTSGPVAGTTTT